MKPYASIQPRPLSLLLLMVVVLMGCPKKESSTDPTPQAQIVGKWEMVSFIVSPALPNGVSDLLAFQRQTMQFNCSELNFFMEFKSDGSLRSWSESTCMSGKVVDEEKELTGWSVNGNKLFLSSSDGTRQEWTYIYKQGTPGKKDTQMVVKTENSGSTYTITYNKL